MAYQNYNDRNAGLNQNKTNSGSNPTNGGAGKNPIFTKCVEEGMTKDSCEIIKEKVEGSYSKINTSQLRKFFSAVKLLQQRGVTDNLSELIMLKPKLAYAVGRDKNNTDLRAFYDDMSNVIDRTYEIITVYKDKKEEKEAQKVANNFIDLFEMIIAYHKFYAKL